VANQDILHDLWMRTGHQCDLVSLSTIGNFALKNKNALRSIWGKQISSSGLNYAVLKFILVYTKPVNWSFDLWDEFERAKDPSTGNYAIWRRYPKSLVNVQSSKE